MNPAAEKQDLLSCWLGEGTLAGNTLGNLKDGLHSQGSCV